MSLLLLANNSREKKKEKENEERYAESYFSLLFYTAFIYA